MRQSSDRLAESQALIKYGCAPQAGRAFSRRGFFAVAGSALTATAYAGLSQQTPTIDVSPDGKILTVKLGEYEWTLSTESFAQRPKFFKWLIDGVTIIELRNARIAGTNIPFNFQARIKSPGNGWQIDLDLNGHANQVSGTREEPPLLVEWLVGATPLRFVPYAIPVPIRIGELQVDSSSPYAYPTMELWCTGIRGDIAGKRDKERVLHLLFPCKHGRAN